MKRLSLLLLFLCVLFPAPAGAQGNGYRTPEDPARGGDFHHDDDDEEDDDEREDHDRAREAVLKGAALPLSRILKDAEGRVPGRFLEAELDEHHGRLIYEVRMLDARGGVTRLEYDAATGALLRRRDGSDRHGKD